ncbi:MAG: ribonuclease E/G, partial [Desulfuromonadaceae bacterium]
MSKKMLINASHSEEHRAVIVEDGALTELEIEVVGREQTRGNIYKAVVVRVESGLQAAFVDYGADRLGFLQMGEIHPSCYRPNDNADSKGRPRINDILHRGQEILVQVVKEERGTKGAALTTYLSLPGRYMVLMPESDTKGISRKIEEESQRKKLKSSMASMNLPDNMGYIVRTAGIGQPKEELKRDFDYLLRVYENILALAKRSKAPTLVYKESNLVIRMIRDYFKPEIHQEKRPIFSRFQIEEQIETINKNKVPLPSGGSIVIDTTEALVAIDVNSGKMASEQGVESTAYKTNLEAAAEVGRQLRLRDLGGLIVIDFIDMRDRKHIRDVEKTLKEALKNDKARVNVGHISSQFSLLEMSRQRIKTTLAEGSFLTCPHCNGSGHIKSTEAQAVAFLRKLQAGIAKGQIGLAEGEVPLDVATYLLNTRREELLLMERQHRLSIVIQGRSDFSSGQFELSFQKREKEEQSTEF